MQIVQAPVPPKCYDSQRTLNPIYIVLHATAGASYEGAFAAYKERGVSAHYTVDLNGKIYQHVPTNRPAYHAGESRWKQHLGLNNYALGIEMVNTNPTCLQPRDDYPMAQVDAVRELVLMLAKQFNIGWKNILTHAMISPGRKHDPADFWPYMDILEAVMQQSSQAGLDWITRLYVNGSSEYQVEKVSTIGDKLYVKVKT